MSYRIRTQRHLNTVETVWEADTAATLPPVWELKDGDGDKAITLDDESLYLFDGRRWVNVTSHTLGVHASTHTLSGTAITRTRMGLGGPSAAYVAFQSRHTHVTGGNDLIYLDQLGAPSDTLALNASPTAHGLMQKYPGGTSTFLRADGSFAAPAGTVANVSTAAQTPAAATRTYLDGSKVVVPSTGLQIGTTLEWTIDLTKTAAGTAASTVDVALGTAGTTADAACLSFTKPAGTADADVALVTIRLVVRGPLTSSGIVSGTFTLVHTGGSTGLKGHSTHVSDVLSVVSSALDLTVANLMLGVCLTSGASDAITIQQVVTTAWNLPG